MKNHIAIFWPVPRSADLTTFLSGTSDKTHEKMARSTWQNAKINHFSNITLDVGT